MLLAGDIGGTKTLLAAYSSETSPQKPIVQRQYPSDQYESLSAMVHDFLAETKLPIQYGCFAVAGPVINGQAKLTNLSWKELTEEGLSNELHFTSVRLMNDLEGIANSVPHLLPDDLHTINRGHVVPSGAIAVIAPGTGLGEAYMTWDGLEYRAHASEGGHANLAPSNMTELKLLEYLWQEHHHVSVERVCSGIGIPNIYNFFKSTGIPETSHIVEAIAQAEDQHRTKVIVEGAMRENPCQLCVKTIQTFAAILGTEAGNLALKQLATGGIYISGGIATSIIPYLTDDIFMKAFQRKGRFTQMLSAVPIHLIQAKTHAALLGAAGYGIKLIYRGSKQA
jgi:glucokinase